MTCNMACPLKIPMLTGNDEEQKSIREISEILKKHGAALDASPDTDATADTARVLMLYDAMCEEVGKRLAVVVLCPNAHRSKWEKAIGEHGPVLDFKQLSTKGVLVCVDTPSGMDAEDAEGAMDEDAMDTKDAKDALDAKGAKDVVVKKYCTTEAWEEFKVWGVLLVISNPQSMKPDTSSAAETLVASLGDAASCYVLVISANLTTTVRGEQKLRLARMMRHLPPLSECSELVVDRSGEGVAPPTPGLALVPEVQRLRTWCVEREGAQKVDNITQSVFNKGNKGKENAVLPMLDLGNGSSKSYQTTHTGPVDVESVKKCVERYVGALIGGIVLPHQARPLTPRRPPQQEPQMANESEKKKKLTKLKKTLNIH